MKITRKQLRKLIQEIYVAGPEGVISGEESDRSPSVHVDDRPFGTAPKRHHIPRGDLVQDLLSSDDSDFVDQGYELSDVSMGYPEGTTKAAVYDENQSKMLSMLYSQGLEVLLPNEEVPEGFKLKSVGIEMPRDEYEGDREHVGLELWSNDEVLQLVVLVNPSLDNGYIYGFIKGLDPKMPDVYEHWGSEIIPNMFKNTNVLQAGVSKMLAELIANHPETVK
jgi:hypothetical protein